ncbi:plasmid stabilization protein [Geothermobacter hydrogeniphilus]|uniref:Plasmid stabilization protein n=1 Tax=Geothermobacter hydrogeniphilus TaxID=1969733 RepID=A0A2K2HA21_9BACT|nr:type II toxin-antitoxin system RelE/ParE family toxin [Geothermobacter hydrogeniphilus]PNU20156.1 plasmid stabilization protein [Geothermobacter hydrogeniphilus]
MAEIVWTDPALDELEEIADYIALDNLPASKSLVQAVFDKVARLENYPESGRFPSELKGLNYREVVVSPCRIFYRIEGEQVFILHVMRQEQDLRKFLLANERKTN